MTNSADLTPERIQDICGACGECCRGQVLWTSDEVDRHPWAGKHIPKDPDDGSPLRATHGCHLFDSGANACTSYAGRPMDCRTFPVSFYLQEHATRVSWTVADCPLGREMGLADIQSAQARFRQMWLTWTAEELAAYLHTPSQWPRLQGAHGSDEPAPEHLTKKVRSVTHRLNVWRLPGLHAQLLGRLLHSETSDFQHIQVLETAFAGRCLFLDNVIQLSSRYWYHTHESIVVPALGYWLSQNPNRPPKSLVLGGGDLGVASLLMDMDCPDVTTVEIDPRVTHVALSHWGDFIHPQAHTQVIHADAFEWLSDWQGERFDLIFLDMPNATGPASHIHTQEALSAVVSALAPDGYVVTHAESPDFQPAAHERALKAITEVFPAALPYRVWIPPYLDCWCRVICCHPEVAPLSHTPVLPVTGYSYRWASTALIHACFQWFDA